MGNDCCGKTNSRDEAGADGMAVKIQGNNRFDHSVNNEGDGLSTHGRDPSVSSIE